MVAAAPKRLLLLIRHSPYGSSLARASLDVALAAAAFDQPVTLLFAGDGVLQLLPEQDTHARGVKNIGRLLASLPLYGIEQVYVDAQAVAHYQFALDTAPLKAVPLDSGQISEMFRNHDQLLGFLNVILHTLNASPASSACSDCLRLLASGDALLLLGDGVYAALAGSADRARLDASGAAVYVLDTDAAAAGVLSRVDGVTIIDIDGFVALTEQCSRQLAWY